MNNFLQELSEIIRLPFNEINKDFKLIMISNQIVYISNYIKIIDYTSERLVLKIYKNIIEISGSNLYISQINKNEIVLKGNIISYCYGGKHEKNENK